MKAVKKTEQFLLVYLVLSTISLTAVAQQYRIIPFAGYTLKESFDFAGKQGVIKENAHYGGIFEFRIKTNYSIELLFQQQKTNTTFSDTISHRVINTLIS